MELSAAFPGHACFPLHLHVAAALERKGLARVQARSSLRGGHWTEALRIAPGPVIAGTSVLVWVPLRLAFDWV